ncbi:NADH-quinone oxidoreductase subunit M [Arcanobacterium pinnipediorum]|uniref:NADH-quinone oxidoreductase subunit M n=1 Tax=Arcanobacterium pinnipediorum TaxID=1503041 RepID=A0ABY5AHJ3_9ACTO|nr:NADH-quinone oxidoreductase subunit M [Arcanobacterium pinnipediorum]USR79659.1 NADH-quinone oxidoreductase subunit M [Arcanobacterium pinnipediorum]
MNIIETSAPWLTILVAIPFISGIVLWLVKPLRAFARQFSLAISILVFAGFVTAFATSFDLAQAGSTQLYETYAWIPQIGVTITWGINGMGAVMLALATVLVPVVILAEWNDFESTQDSGYFAWVLVLEAIMIGLFSARDIFLFYVFFEALIIPVYFMIGRYGGAQRTRAAMKFLLFSLAGGLIMLAGVIAVYAYGSGGPRAFVLDDIAGTLRLTDTSEMWIFMSFFIAFAIKAPMWPVHTWLPDTAQQASPGTSTLLVGILDKLGTFGMIAICLPLFSHAVLVAAPVVITLAVISIIWGALMAISSDNMLRLVAYTSVSHFGFIVMGIFSGSALALSGSILYMVAHGIGTAGLFLVIGFLERRGKSYLISDYGGWQRVTPVLAGSFLITGLATIALPGLSGFIPEYLVLMGTYSLRPYAAIVAAIGVVLASLYILLPYQRAFTGPKPHVDVPDLGGREKTVMGVLIAVMLGLGFYPAPILDLVTPVAENSTIIAVSTPDNAQVSIEGSTK